MTRGMFKPLRSTAARGEGTTLFGLFLSAYRPEGDHYVIDLAGAYLATVGSEAEVEARGHELGEPFVVGAMPALPQAVLATLQAERNGYHAAEDVLTYVTQVRGGITP